MKPGKVNQMSVTTPYTDNSQSHN